MTPIQALALGLCTLAFIVLAGYGVLIVRDVLRDRRNRPGGRARPPGIYPPHRGQGYGGRDRYGTARNQARSTGLIT